MTEYDAMQVKQQIVASDKFEPHFAIKLGLLLLAELVLALWSLHKALSNLEKKVV